MGVRVCEICKEGHDYKSGFFTRHTLRGSIIKEWVADFNFEVGSNISIPL